MALGYDEGTVVVKIGREEPVASMDSGGKVIWARHNEIQTVNVRSAPEGDLEVWPIPCLELRIDSALFLRMPQPKDMIC